MLSVAIAEEIDRLLREGKLSQRQIAARLGVSRGSVGAIANGQRGLHGKETWSENPEATDPALLPERCPHCGHRVYMPCLVCRTREYCDVQRMQRELAIIGVRSPRRKRRRRRAARGRRPRRSRVA